MHGLTRKYSDTVLENSQPNTSFPNGFSFMELVNGMSSPGDIAFVEYTLGATTYCVQERGNNGPASMCPSGDTPVADGTTSNGVTVKVHNYPGSSTADNDVLVTGIGTFDVTISDESSTGGSCQGSTAPAGCTGDATPVGWAEVNSNTSLDGGEIFATGGTTTFN